MYKSIDISRYILIYAKENHQIVSNLKLQKILYFIQAQFLVSTNCSCFYEDIEAWEIGPIIPNVYYKYAVYGGGGIPVLNTNEKFNFICKKDKIMINDIIDDCLNYSSSSLMELTLNQEPWLKSYQKNKKNIISESIIKEYFDN